MRRKFFLAVLFAVPMFLLASAASLCAQTVPAAREGGLPLMVGGGLADDNIDYGEGRRMTGISAWVDWDLPGYKFVPKGLGLEAEGRTIRFGVPSGFSQMRQESALGGVIYSWRHYPNIRPFAKGLMGIGSIKFPPYGAYGHDTRTVKVFGGGIDYRVYRSIWLRAQYEYQIWPQYQGTYALTPNGYTIGASYDFRHFRRK
jgi:opacity protein-like surface antigen